MVLLLTIDFKAYTREHSNLRFFEFECSFQARTASPRQRGHLGALMNQLDEDEKNALIKIINSMLTKKRMKDLLDGKIKLAL